MRSKRNTELLLLLAALPALVLLFATDILNSGTQVTLSSFAVPLSLFAAFVLAHLAVRKFAPNADSAILPITFLLSGIGIAFVMRLAPDLAPRQIGWLYLSIAAMIAVLIFVKSLDNLSHYKYTILLAGIILLLLPAFIGTEVSGSKIWIVFAGFSFQPGEIAKVLIVLFLAAYISENREMLSVFTHRVLGVPMPDLRTLVPLLIMWIISLLIVIFERDLGSALLFFGIFLIMIYAGTGRISYILSGALLIAISAVFLYKAFPHVQARVAIWLDPFSYAQTTGYQLVQAIYSMADGGLFGTGIGRGMPTKIPVIESDFIFAAIAEEMGLLGASAVLILYLLFTIRGFLTAARAKTDMAAFTAVGLTSAISFQAFVIVGGVTRLIPLTGITLPFMSQGGSSLLASFIIVGLLLKAGDEGTGLETEMEGPATLEGGVLGRVALGKRLTQLAWVFAALFALLIGNLTYIQVFKADYYKNLPSNNHTIARAAQNERGTILSSDNVVLAQSVLQDDGLTYSRYYPLGAFASQVIGYDDSQYGMSGIEASENEALTGTRDFSSWQAAIEALAGAKTTGNDVVLTIDSTVQKVAEEQLSGVTGAIVAMDPETGAIIAMASSPTYDPNDIETVMTSTDASSGALYNRATQALYAPGSTFKIITLAAALDSNTATRTTVYSSPGSMQIGGAAVTSINNSDYGDITLEQGLDLSSNVVFGQVAVQIGARKLVSYAQVFGFGQDVGQDFDAATSLMPDPSEMTDWETAWAGCGQPVGQHSSPAGPQATVLQMAMAGAAIANGGKVMNPYLVEKVLSPAGAVVRTTQPESLGQAVSSSTAATEMDMLTNLVAGGYGGDVSIDGVSVAGKTGTAQTGNAEDNGWFVMMAPSEDAKVVVAVVIEQGGEGSQSAGPRAKAVMEAALKAKGVLS